MEIIAYHIVRGLLVCLAAWLVIQALEAIRERRK
jgi:hypothetical protein